MDGQFIVRVFLLLIIKIMKDDNSCLFSSIAYLIKQENTLSLRNIVATNIQKQEYYTEAILGMSKEKYCSWIKQPNSWVISLIKGRGY